MHAEFPRSGDIGNGGERKKEQICKWKFDLYSCPHNTPVIKRQARRRVFSRVVSMARSIIHRSSPGLLFFRAAAARFSEKKNARTLRIHSGRGHACMCVFIKNERRRG